MIRADDQADEVRHHEPHETDHAGDRHRRRGDQCSNRECDNANPAHIHSPWCGQPGRPSADVEVPAKEQQKHNTEHNGQARDGDVLPGAGGKIAVGQKATPRISESEGALAIAAAVTAPKNALSAIPTSEGGRASPRIAAASCTMAPRLPAPRGKPKPAAPRRLLR